MFLSNKDHEHFNKTECAELSKRNICAMLNTLMNQVTVVLVIVRDYKKSFVVCRLL